MSASSSRSIRSPIGWHRAERWPRTGAALVLGLFVVTLVFSFRATERPGRLGMTVERAADGHRIAWVLPAGQAWYNGARPGMQVRSIGGVDVAAISDLDRALATATDAVVAREDGEELTLVVQFGNIRQNSNRVSLWLLAVVFVLLGALVLLRRPDLAVTRIFVLFATATGLSLTIAPAAGGPHVTWAMIAQFGTLCGVGMSFLPLAVAIVEATRFIPVVFAGFASAAALVFASYAWVFVSMPERYDAIRLALVVFIILSAVGALVILGAGSFTAGSATTRRQCLLCLTGLALGVLPFFVLTLGPVALQQQPLVPSYVSILFWGVIPAAFAGAIRQYGLLGIRRLLHRGMVYGLASFGVLFVISLVVAASTAWSGASPGGAMIAGLVILGALAFQKLHPLSKRVVDRLFYGDPVDYGTLASAVRRDVVRDSSARPAVQAILDRIVDLCDLESALLFLGDDPATARLAVSSGKHREQMARAHGDLAASLEHLEGQDLVELQWESNELLATSLVSSERYLGHVIWGPKLGGEVFLPDEKDYLAVLPPILGLVVDRSALSEELRQLNHRLVRAQELERRRVASDLHDGPLQKALLLGNTSGRSPDELSSLARDVVSELREVCSRLRPAILDDLGLVPALEWLLDDLSGRSKLSLNFATSGITEYERLSPDAELTLFRVVQEALSNVVKHAQAGSAKVSLSREGETIVLAVEDDGVGFVAQETSPGFGLAGMRERVLQLGGTFQVSSNPGAGAALVARIPSGYGGAVG